MYDELPRPVVTLYMSNEENLGWLFDIGDCTQLFADYKPWNKDPY